MDLHFVLVPRMQRFVALNMAKLSPVLTHLVVSVDGLLAPEFQFFVKTLSLRLAEKWCKAYSVTVKWVRTRLNFAIFRSTNLCIRRNRTKWRAMRFVDEKH